MVLIMMAMAFLILKIQIVAVIANVRVVFVAIRLTEVSCPPQRFAVMALGVVGRDLTAFVRLTERAVYTNVPEIPLLVRRARAARIMNMPTSLIPMFGGVALRRQLTLRIIVVSAVR